MAILHEKYGTPPDIETKPEWVEFQDVQKLLLDQLHELTRVPRESLLELLQKSLTSVLGDTDTPVALTRDSAEAIVQALIVFAAMRESRTARANGMMN